MNFHYYPSAFTSESRMLREIESVVNLGLSQEVVVVGVHRVGLPFEESIGNNCHLCRIRSWSLPFAPKSIGKLFEFLQYCAKGFWKGFRAKPSVINCHSLNVLPVGAALRLLGRTRRLIYDAHELETERETLNGLPKAVSKVVERCLMRWVDHMIVVSPPIAEWYRTAYPGQKISVVRNVPKRKVAPSADDGATFRSIFEIGERDLVFIYQGVLSPARGVHSLIEAFRRAGGHRHLVLMGYGPSVAEIKSISASCPNIHFHPAVDPANIIEKTSGADVGLVFLDHGPSLSYRYSLPNKFFEYLCGACPVIVSDNLQYLSLLVERHGLGWVAPADPEKLADLLRSIDVDTVSRLALNARKYAGENRWEDDEPFLAEAYGRSAQARQ